MATERYYVNLSSSNYAGGNGTTNTPSETDPDRPFKSLSEAESTLNGENIFGHGVGVLQSGDTVYIDCDRGGGARDTTIAVITGWTTAVEENQIVIRGNRDVATGFNDSTAAWDEACYVLERNGYGGGLRVDQHGVTIDGVQVENIKNSSAAYGITSVGYSTRIENCSVTGSNCQGIVYSTSNSGVGDSKAYNNVCFGMGVGLHCGSNRSTAHTLDVYNNAFIDMSSYGLRVDYPSHTNFTVNIYNNYTHNITTTTYTGLDDADPTINVDYNAGEGTAPTSHGSNWIQIDSGALDIDNAVTETGTTSGDYDDTDLTLVTDGTFDGAGNAGSGTAPTTDRLGNAHNATIDIGPSALAAAASDDLFSKSASFTITDAGATTFTTTPGADNLAISGKAPTANLIQRFTTEPGVDSLAISGKAPTANLIQRFTTEPGVDNLAISGKAPSAPYGVVYDTFTDTDGVNLVDHDAAIEIDSVGTGWLPKRNQGLEVVSNKAQSIGGVTNSDVVDAGTADVVIRFSGTVGTGGTNAAPGFLVRTNGADGDTDVNDLDGYLIRIDRAGNTVAVYAMTDGSLGSALDSVAPTISDGDTYSGVITLSGNNIDVSISGDFSATLSTTDSTHTGTHHGLYFLDNGSSPVNTLDYFQIVSSPSGLIEVTPGVGNLTISGKAPVASLGLIFTTEPGADNLAISGKAPTANLVEVFTTEPGVDNLAISGKAPTANLIQRFTTEPGVDNLTISGKAPIASLGLIFTTEPGADNLAISGKAPAVDLIEIFTIEPGVDNLIISGKAPTANLIEVFTTEPGVDNLTISGKAPEVSLGLVFTTEPGVDNLAISGKAPTVDLTEVFTTEPGVDNLAISGKAPTANLIQRFTTQPGVDNLTISGKAPTVGVNLVFTTQPGVDSLTISGKAPSLALSVTFTTQPGVDSITLTGNAPTVQLAVIFNPAPGVDSLAISGKAPIANLVERFVVTPGTDNLAISGQTLTIAGSSLVQGSTFISLRDSDSAQLLTVPQTASLIRPAG